MNFAFKSTFNITKNRLRRVSNPLWILLANTASFVIVITLYLTNTFLPATIGSRPHGNLYILLIEVAIAIKILSSVYATVFLIRRFGKKSSRYVAEIFTLSKWLMRITLFRLRYRYTPLIIQRVITKTK